jgi:hypothetical protein
VEQPPSRSVHLHCLLYLSADRICRPVSGRPGDAVADFPRSKRHWLLRWIDSELEWEGPSRKQWAAQTQRVSVPCRPTVEVMQMDLGSRLLMAALLDCRDAGQLQLRLAEGRRDWRARITDPQPSRVRVAPLASASVPDLCGRILETLARTGEQGAKKLLRTMMGDFYAEWVIAQVEAELVNLGYMRTQTTPWWRPTGNFPRIVADCEQIRTLEQACAQAEDRWRRLTLADQQLCDALLADCTDSITPSRYEDG